MDNIGYPPQFFHGLHNAAHKEYAALVVVVEVFSFVVDQEILPQEIVVVIDKIDLHAGRLYRCHLDNQRMIGIIDDKVHSRQTYHLMQLIATLIDITVFGHESTDFPPSLLNALRQISTYRCNFRIGKIRSHLLRNEQHLFCFHHAVF